jgi:Uma2 family endonuclease
MATKIASTPPLVEAERPWPIQGEWTYEDYLRLPDDGKRYEIIEGVLYVTNAPDYNHQFTVTKLDRLIGTYVDEQKLGVVLVAPFEIHLPGIARPVQPDLFFIAAQRQPQPGDKSFTGAPDIIIEVLSASTARLDRVVKFDAYERAGVREYWLADADPRSRFIEVYTLSAAGAEYTLLGQFGPGEQLRSEVLPKLVLTIDTMFTPVETR